MKYKKFKLNPNLKRNLQTLDSELTQKLVGGNNTASSLERNNPWTPLIESNCGYYCRAICEGACRVVSFQRIRGLMR